MNELIGLLTTTYNAATEKPLAVYEVITGTGLTDTYLIYAAKTINGVLGYPCSRVSVYVIGKTRFDASWLVTDLDVKAGSAPLLSALAALNWA
jgi:hypothetical protein